VLYKGKGLNRYSIERSSWRQSGPRRGLLRKKSMVYITKTIDKCNSLDDADLIFVAASVKPGEMVILVDTILRIRLDTKYG
jgi:hypothetical protein